MAADGGPPRARGVVLLMGLALAACTGSSPPAPGPEEAPSGDGASGSAIVVPVVVSVGGRDAPADASYLDGIRLGVRTVNRGGGVGGRSLELRVMDDHGDPHAAADLLRQAVAGGAPAVLVVGEAASVTAARPDIERAGTPVVLLRGDAYSSRELFRQVFQTSLPLRWQAAVISRYFVKDRGHGDVVLVTDAGPAEAEEREALDAAMAEEGSAPSATVSLGQDALGSAVARADGVVYLGAAGAGDRVVEVVDRLEDPPQLAVASDGLQEAFGAGEPLAPGTVAPYPYTWAGWAEPIRRVRAFRNLCRRVLGHLPYGFEQEGSDAVRVLADALDRTGGRGGDRLVRALEATDATFSSLPVALGPDDHLFLSDRQLGLFAVEAPGQEPEAWVPDWAPWRPVMRTFSANGERTTVLDHDKRVFFPGWRPPRPAPDFWTSRYGIATLASDPLH